uniref:Uncharacterized protein n=1 Tax=Oryza glaberrima TaxID=4538 RepID=I1PKD1_ORYGL
MEKIGRHVIKPKTQGMVYANIGFLSWSFRFPAALFQSEKCAKLKQSRENVKFHQCTGSRSYIAAAYIAKQEKYKDTEPTAIDLFKLTHCRKTKGFSDDVMKAAMQELQAQLEAEKEESTGLCQKVLRLEAQAEESKAKAQKQAEEIENLKKAITDTQKAAADTQNLIRQMIAFGQTQRQDS